MLPTFIAQLGLILLKVVCLLVAIAYYTIAERKIMAAIQRRRGPNVVGFWGLLQPLADGLKLIAKEMVVPSHSNSRIFVLAPLVILTLSLISWSIIPFGCFDHSEYLTTDYIRSLAVEQQVEQLGLFTFITKKAAGLRNFSGSNLPFRNCLKKNKAALQKTAGIIALLVIYWYSPTFAIEQIYCEASDTATSNALPAESTVKGRDPLTSKAANSVAWTWCFLILAEMAMAAPVMPVHPGVLSLTGTGALLVAALASDLFWYSEKEVEELERKEAEAAEMLVNATSPKQGEIVASEDAKAAIFDILTESDAISNVSYGVLVILALSSLTVYGLIIAGWASNSKYAFLGALRSAAQMISYEVAISLVLLPVILMTGSLNFTEIVHVQSLTTWFVFPLLPIAIVFFISMIAETNRTPFDLPEAEAELVAGYNVEYSSIIFAMFFLAEYGNMIMMSLLAALLFLGGWSFFAPVPAALVLTLKGLIFCFLFVLVRATFPRYRYDQLMDIGWKIFLPLSTGYLLLVVGLLMTFDALPVVNEITSEIYSEPSFRGA